MAEKVGPVRAAKLAEIALEGYVVPALAEYGFAERLRLPSLLRCSGESNASTTPNFLFSSS